MVKKAIWLLACAVLGVAAYACVPRLFLTVEDKDGAVVFLRPVRAGDRYTVRFVHSVARTPVDEIYEITPGASTLRETVYDMFGAGLPSEPLEGQSFSVEDGKFHIRGFELKIPALTYRTGKIVADHRLIVGAENVALGRLVASPGDPVTLRVRRLMPLQLLSLRKNLRVRTQKGE